MNETLIGTTPSIPMTNVQRRTHRRLATAEKRLIHLMVWNPDPALIERQERVCARLTQSWRKACER